MSRRFRLSGLGRALRVLINRASEVADAGASDGGASSGQGYRVILVVGDEEPQRRTAIWRARTRTDTTDPEAFYTEIALRIATTASTQEVTAHQVLDDPVRRLSGRNRAF